jgi:drug/metabolite transporter (DMT)-like permease
MNEIELKAMPVEAYDQIDSTLDTQEVDQGHGEGMDGVVIIPKDHKLKSIIAINLYAFTWPLEAILFRKAKAGGADVAEFILSRAFVMLLMCLVLIVVSQKHPWNDIPSGKFKIVFVRNILGLLSFGLWIWAVQMAPLGLVVILVYTNPFWSTLMGFWFNKEPILKF